jgi:hypothetical protein
MTALSTTATLTAVTVAVALAAAVRSTWSPCGLSMLSTITPFGERSKGHRYGATATWFVVGAVAGGLSLGALAAAGAAGVGALHLSDGAVAAVALAATLVALASDTGLAGRRLPIHGRQVNERWLDAFRPWVYGAGFGWQIGCGLATYITTAAVYLVVVLSALGGRPAVELAVGGAFGLVRGLAVLLTARLEDPAALLAFHRRFAAAGVWAHRLVVAVLALSAAALGAVGRPGATAAVLVAGAVAVAVSRATWRPGAGVGEACPVVSDPSRRDRDEATPAPDAPAVRSAVG